MRHICIFNILRMLHNSCIYVRKNYVHVRSTFSYVNNKHVYSMIPEDQKNITKQWCSTGRHFTTASTQAQRQLQYVKLNWWQGRKALMKHSLREKTAASVLLKLLISGNEWCTTCFKVWSKFATFFNLCWECRNWVLAFVPRFNEFLLKGPEKQHFTEYFCRFYK